MRISQAAGGQQPWAVCVKDQAGSANARHSPGSTPAAGRGLAAMWFSSDRAALAPRCDFRTIRLRQIVEDYTIGNVVADVGLPALVLARHLDGTLDRPAETGRGIRRPGDRYLPCSDRLSPVAEDRPHFYVQTLDAASADAPASRPSSRAGQRAPG